MKKINLLFALLCLASGQVFSQDFTNMVKDMNPGVGQGISLLNLFDVNGTLFFVANDGLHGHEPCKSNGTAAGTTLIKDICPGNWPSSPDYRANLNGVLLCNPWDSTHGKELWKSDLTEAGTVLIKDIWPGIISANVNFLVEMNGAVFFNANDGIHGAELWKTDGTATGTVMVKDIFLGADTSYPAQLTKVNGTLFFVAANGASTNRELWKSDGTEAGTVLVKDIRPGDEGSSPVSLVNVDGTLFFYANDGVHGYELWCSDGTYDGTVMVKDIWPGLGGSYAGFRYVSIDGTLFFAARDSIHANDYGGGELWKSDGTASGTVMVKDIFPGMGESSPGGLTEVNGTLFFAATQNSNGRELWKSNGTESGTVMVKDIWPGSGSSIGTAPVGKFVNNNGTLFFAANNGAHGEELWKSNGTAAGTVMVKDIRPGTAASEPHGLISMNGDVFFTANDGTHGRELWMSTTIPFFYADTDGDGFGNPNVYIRPGTTTPPAGYAANDFDCNDADPAFPKYYYPDADGDGYGSSSADSLLTCTPPTGYVANNTDCDDTNGLFHPGATDVCGNSFDENCNGFLSDPIFLWFTGNQNASCASSTDGSLFLAVNCGVGPFTFLWSNGATTHDLIGVPHGTYTVTVTDSQGLTQAISNTIGINPPISLTYKLVKPTCPSGSNGTIQVNPTAPVAGYTYHWNNGATTRKILNVAAGTYSVTVTKTASGCSAVGSTTLADPTPLTLSYALVQPSCAGGTNGSVTVNHAAGTYTYQWNNGATTKTISNVTAGTYSVTVTKPSTGCTAFGTTTLSQPTPVTIAATVVNNKCFGQSIGSITATANGGTGAKTYTWSNGGSTNKITNLPAATYTVTATDTKGCTISATATVTQPPQLVLNYTMVPAAGDTNKYKVTLSASGGTPYATGVPYRYCKVSATGSCAFSTTTVYSNLLPGTTYFFRAKDSNSCIVEISATTPITLTQTDYRESENLNHKDQFDIRCRPNPFADELTVEIGNPQVGNWQIRVMDAAGRPVAEASLPVGQATWTWQSPPAASGLYFVQIRSSSGVWVLPVTLVR